MHRHNYKYFFLIHFENIHFWDVNKYTQQIWDSIYDKVDLLNCINEESRKHKIYKDEEKEFGILGINNRNGIFDAYLQKGKEINQAYKYMEDGWLAYNPYRVNVGSIGIKRKEQYYQYISPAYVVFSCKENLLPDYLYLTFKTNIFNQYINENTIGSVRQILSFDTLKSLQIPLPALLDQQRLVNKYNTAIRQTEKQEQQANKLEEDIENYLCEALGIEKQKEEKWEMGKLYFVKLDELTRWDISYVENSNLSNTKSKYKTVTLHNLITCLNKDLKGYSLRIETKNFSQNIFQYIGMENVEKNTGHLIEIQQLYGNQIKSQTIKIPKEYIIYGKLRPYLNKYWMNELDYSNVVCSSEFFVFQIVNSIDKQYFINILGSYIVQRQISDLTSGARMPRISEDIFMNIQIPLPPLSIQKEIAKHIHSMKEQIKDLRQSAEEHKRRAIIEFEQEIFKNT
jgi:restriction endonuclease S subunit